MMDVPAFDRAGLLPPGDVALTLDELRRSVLVWGSAGGSTHHVRGATWEATWDAAWRAELVERLAVLAAQLRQVGIRELFIDGSFVEDKDHPNDIDGYFECSVDGLASGALERELNRLDPHASWTWDPERRRPYRGYPKRQLPMWHRYRVELYPHVPGLLSGLQDEHGHELEFPAAFRRSRRDGRPKGIVKLLLEAPV